MAVWPWHISWLNNIIYFLFQKQKIRLIVNKKNTKVKRGCFSIFAVFFPFLLTILVQNLKVQLYTFMFRSTLEYKRTLAHFAVAELVSLQLKEMETSVESK